MDKLEKTISDELYRMNIFPHYKGYKVIMDITWYIVFFDIKDWTMQDMYNRIRSTTNMSQTCCERNMRSVIAKSYARDKGHMIKKVLGCDVWHEPLEPGNKTFMKLFVEHIKKVYDEL